MATEMVAEVPAEDADDNESEDQPETKDGERPAKRAYVVPSANEQIVMAEEVQSLDQFVLGLKGFTAKDVQAFKFQGIHTLQQLRVTLTKDLFNVDIPEEKIERVLTAVKKEKCSSGAFGFRTALDLREERKNMARLSTGSKELDRILGGGVETGSITEIFGEFCCGKTQICHTMSVIAQLPPEHGGNNGRVLYLDTEGTFRPERIQQIASCRGLPFESVMENILVARAINSEHLMELLTEAAGHMCASEEQFALIIVDSIMAGFRVDYKSDEIMLRQTTLGRVLSKLQKLSEEFKVAVVLTNQVASRGGGSGPSGIAGLDKDANNPKPIGGHVIAHSSTTRVSLRKGDTDKMKVAKIYDSPYLAIDECTFTIGDNGIHDAK